jgi:hypothetical protein
MNSGWIVVSQRLFDDGAESMLVPAVANFRKKTKIQRVFCACCDVVYYSIRYYVVFRGAL